MKFSRVSTTILSAAMLLVTAGAAQAAGKAHSYNLNIIGTSDKSAPMDNNNGRRIFVKLQGNSKIWLSEGPEFAVLDANATDGNGGRFQLPNPDPDGDGVTEYSVYARALGKPGGSSTTTACTYDDVEGAEYCSVFPLVMVREKGKSSWDNVSKELLYIYVDLVGDDGIPERYSLFDDALYNYFWNYDNNGLKLVQLRFYEIATDVN